LVRFVSEAGAVAGAINTIDSNSLAIIVLRSKHRGDLIF